MPYKLSGSNVLHYKDGKWSIKQHCSSHENAVKALGLLQGLEHGSIKPEEVGKKKHTSAQHKIAKKMNIKL